MSTSAAEVYDTLQDVWYGAPATFLVMEYIEGTSLAQIIDEKRSLEGSDVVHLFLELLGILDYLHSRVPPILHRDIKPRLRSVIARLLRPSPAERFASARDVRNALVGGGSPASGPSGGSGSPSAVALSSVSKPSLQRASPSIEAALALPPAPRELRGETKALMKRSTPSTLRLLSASEKGYQDWGLVDVVALAFFSVITAGILPIVYANMASTRRRRMRRFFRDGDAAIAEVTKIDTEKLPFDEKIARVNYQFQADGQIHRDSDTVLLAIANRWQPGDQIPVLYMRERDYDSVIVAVE